MLSSNGTPTLMVEIWCGVFGKAVLVASVTCPLPRNPYIACDAAGSLFAPHVLLSLFGGRSESFAEPFRAHSPHLLRQASGDHRSPAMSPFSALISATLPGTCTLIVFRNTAACEISFGLRYNRKGLESVVTDVRTIVSPLLVGRSPRQQRELDAILWQHDETDTKHVLGGRAEFRLRERISFLPKLLRE